MKHFKRISTVLAIFMIASAITCAPAYGQFGTIGRAWVKIVGKGGKEAGKSAVRRKAGKNLMIKTSEETAQKTLRETSVENIGKTFTRSVASEMKDHVFLISGSRAAAAAEAGNTVAGGLVKRMGSAETVAALERNASRALDGEVTRKAAKKSSITAVNRRIGEDAVRSVDDIDGLSSLVIVEMPRPKPFPKPWPGPLPDPLPTGSKTTWPDGTGPVFFSERVGMGRRVGYSGTATEMILDSRGVAHMKAGASSEAGEMNEFLNYTLPNRKYLVDDAVTYTTDGLGRTVNMECHSSALSKSVSRAANDAGDAIFLQPQRAGGPSESINVLSLDAAGQRSVAKYLKFEEKEMKAVSRGNDVWSSKTVTYNADGTCTVSARLTVTDPKTGRTTVKSRTFDGIKAQPGKNAAAKKASSSAGAAKSRLPRDGEKGRWTGNRGNSTYELDPDYRPKNKAHNNPEGKTVRELADDLGDKDPIIRYKDNYPQFDRDGGAPGGKPMSVTFDDGIGEYLNKRQVIANGGKNVDRSALHEEAYRRLAAQYGKTVDEIKVFKGDLAAAERLAEKWGCSVDEAFARCGNPKRIPRVLHECEDGKTVQLVPELYHSAADHTGGIEKAASEILAAGAAA